MLYKYLYDFFQDRESIEIHEKLYFFLQHMVQTGMAAPYGGGVFPPPVNGVAGVVGAAGAAGDVKPPPPVPVKEDNAGAPQQPPPTGGPQVPPAAGAPHPSAPGAPTAASFSPPPPPNGVDQQAIVSPNFLINASTVPSDRSTLAENFHI